MRPAPPWYPKEAPEDRLEHLRCGSCRFTNPFPLRWRSGGSRLASSQKAETSVGQGAYKLVDSLKMTRGQDESQRRKAFKQGTISCQHHLFFSGSSGTGYQERSA